ncbi:MAG: hypothetical protein EBZ36_09800 [Acidobacteria bacterium]|nr:hypothetical protein [Acidobacteriota bacterium]
MIDQNWPYLQNWVRQSGRGEPGLPTLISMEKAILLQSTPGMDIKMVCEREVLRNFERQRGLGGPALAL